MNTAMKPTAIPLDWDRLLGFDQVPGASFDSDGMDGPDRADTGSPVFHAGRLGAKIGPKEARGFAVLSAKVGLKPRNAGDR